MNPCEWLTRTKVDLVAHESVAYIDRHHRTLKLQFVDFHDFRHLSEPLFIFGAWVFNRHQIHELVFIRGSFPYQKSDRQKAHGN